MVWGAPFGCELAHRWAPLNVFVVSWTVARLLLIVHFEETGISGDVFCPQLLHHRLHFMGPKVFATREHVSKLVWIYGSDVWRARMRSIRSPGWQVDNTLGRNLKLR